jgi:hypothetical protein
MNDENLKPCQPGETHNKAGKPKGIKNWSTIFKKYMKLKIKPSDIGIELTDRQMEDQQLTYQDIIALRLLHKTMKKVDARDIELIINRTDGLLTQKVDQTNRDADEESIEEIDKKIEELKKQINAGNTTD